MSNIIRIKDIYDYLVNLSKRIDRLEAGGRPQVGIANRAGTGAITLNAGEDLTGLAATLTWSNADIQAVIGAVPYLTIYVDNDLNPAYQWPSGVSLNAGQRNIEVVSFMDEDWLLSNSNEARFRIYLRNRDSSQHTLYVYINFTYVTGGSGSS